MAYSKSNKLHIVAVTAVIRRPEDGRYLVVKRAPHEIAFPNMWTFPGGKVEDNQTIWEALREEVEEEVGLQLREEKIPLKDAAFIRPDNQTVKVFSYLCEVEDSSQVKLEDDFTDYKWVTMEELKKLPHVGIVDELKKAEELLNSQTPLTLLATKSEKVD